MCTTNEGETARSRPGRTPRVSHEPGRAIVRPGAVLCALLLFGADSADAQRRGGGGVDATVRGGVEVVLSTDDRAAIREYYEHHRVPQAAGLPPGIRKRLARGKPLPPGIAKRTPPAELRSRVVVPGDYELVEVGLDVLLVEVATGVIHDVLMDVIR